MVIPEKFEKRLEYDQEMRKDFETIPLAFFGCIVKYPKQAEIIRTWLREQPKICVITGWKRTTKTSIGAYIGSCWGIGRLKKAWPGARAMGIEEDYNWTKTYKSERVGLIGGRSFEHIDSVLLKQYQELIPKPFVRDWYSKGKPSIHLYGGCRFVIRSYDQILEQWKSGNYQFIHLDEEAPWEMMNECLERTRLTKGKILITVAVDDADVSWLPDACLNPLKTFGTESFRHFKLGVEDVPDDIYPPEEKRACFVKFDGTVYEQAARKGEFAFASGKWLPEFDPSIHVIKPFKIPGHWLKWRFMDAGTAAPAGCMWVAIDPENKCAVGYREYYKSGTTIDERCRDIIQLSENIRKLDGDIWVEEECGEKFVSTLLDYHEFKTDQITGDGLDYHYVAAGISVQPSTTLGQEARRLVARKFLEVDKSGSCYGKPGKAKFYVFETCVNFIWEVQRKCVKRPVNERSSVIEKRIQNRDDHLIDCFEYACCELENWINDTDARQAA